MSLTPGTRLGHYDVTALIGEGGMGQVWQATDTQLNRQVALKILPDAFADDPDRLARFQREAQVLASLNHPGIAQIHGIEEAEGTRALVLELVEGPTLADRISKGPIPLDEALPIAKQIAEALEAAHEAGVIHRDLKPANIKVKDDGTVKVLDFGLAKAFQPDASDPNVSASPTISLTAAATQMGMIIGTAAYMAPEQARGKPVDRRADIWAFGVVLYEMLTGTRPFPGDDLSQMLARVIDRDPDWTPLPADLPVGLERYLRRCLQKDPTQRVQAIGDVRLALDGAFDLPDRGEVPVAVASGGGSMWWMTALAAGGIAVGALLTTVFGPVRETTSDDARWLELAFPTGGSLSVTTGRAARQVAISDDGRTVAFSMAENGVSRLYVRSLEDGTTELLPGTEDSFAPFFSPDGEWLGFFTDAELRRVSLSGGAPLTICAVPQDSFGGAWAPDGTIVFSRRVSGLSRLFRVPVEGGPPEQLTALDSDDPNIGHPWPDLLPGGEWVLFTRFSIEASSRLALLSLETGERRDLGDGTGGRFVASGHVLFFRGTTLWAMGFDPLTLDVTSEPAPVLDDIWTGPAADLADFDVSDDGRLVYAGSPAAPSERSALFWFDSAGASTPATLEESEYRNPRVSPDGTQAIVTISGGQRRRLWLLDVERKVGTSLPARDGNKAVWSRDGRRFAFTSERSGSEDIYLAAMNSADGATRVTTSGNREEPTDWTSGDDTLLFTRVDPVTNEDIWAFSVGDGNESPVLVTPAGEQGAILSPGGKWMACQSNTTGRDEVWVTSYPDPEFQRQVSSGSRGARQPRWSADGRELYYLAGAGDLTVVSIETEPTLRVGEPHILFRGVGSYDSHPDGRFLVDPTPTGPTHLNVILNWDDELERLLPSS